MMGGRRSDAGYTLVALMATLAIASILMAAGVPTWRYLMKNSNEEELIYRGGEIADAIQRYQRKNGNALPPSLEVLVKGKYLRHAYKDPMKKDGKWRFLRPGEAIGATAPASTRPGLPGSPSPSPGSQPTPAAPGFPGSVGAGNQVGTTPNSVGTIGGTLGVIQGVASTSDETGLRVFNGRTKYNEWLFLPGQPRVVGRPQGVVQPGGITPGPLGPGGSPPPSTTPAAPR
jgi:type II secretory pathway pseudopilin PulG